MTEQRALPSTVEHEIRIEARPQTVFEYFVDPQRMVRWQGIDALLDPSPGGAYRVDMNGRDVASGRYVEVDPPRRVVFTWGWETAAYTVPPGSTTVEVTLIPDGDGTILRLLHRDLPDDRRDVHLEGWKHYLSRLQIAAAGGDPGVDTWIQEAPDL